jgi:hypothetical protein
MYNNDDIMNNINENGTYLDQRIDLKADKIVDKLDKVRKDLFKDINVLSNQVHRLRRKIYDEKNLEPELFIIDEEQLTLDTYRLIDFIDFFNEKEFFEKQIQLFLDKDDALEYLKDLEIKNGIKELVEVNNE